MMKASTRWAIGALLCLAQAVAPTEAWALQPLSVFIQGALAKNPDAAIASATISQREAQVDQERARLLPSFAARGVYTRNQYPVEITLPGAPSAVTITPENQLDAFLVLEVPLVDLAQFARYSAQKTQRRLAEASREVTHRRLQEQVIRAYYTVAATWAVERSAHKSLELAEANLTVVQQRVSAGIAPEIDQTRAVANLERARQGVADAELSRVLAMRTLETLSRVTPDEPSYFPEDDLREERTLKTWMDQGYEHLPELKAARIQLELAQDTVKAADLAYLPTLSAQAQERLTNSTGFAGQSANYTLSATLAFRFDLGIMAQQKLAQANAAVSRAEADKAQRTAEDAIVEAWQRVKTNIVKARSARAQVEAASSGAELTQDRYSIGTVTQLDVTDAQREAYQADIARIQADLELVQSRSILRLAAGENDFDSKSMKSHALEQDNP